VVEKDGNGKKISMIIRSQNIEGIRIFIIEGVITVVVALSAYFVVPTWSHKAKFVR